MADETNAPLSPAQRSKIRRLSQPQEHDPSEAGGELNIVPFLDIITNVLMFVLATIPAVFTVTIETNPPSSGGSGTRAKEKAALNLTMLITDSGVGLKGSGANVGPGCTPGAGMLAPKQNGAYDWATVQKCAKQIKDSNPDYADETTVLVIPEPQIDYQSIIDGLDALRSDEKGDPLFPDANFGVAK